MKTGPSFLKWALWTAAAVYYFYEFLLRVSPGVMVPELMQSFNITASSVGILSAFYLYAYAPMQLPVGVLMDRYGVKKVLSIACIACGCGALIFAIAQQLFVANIGRLIIGASSAFAFIAMVYVTSHWFPIKKRAFLIGLANSMAMLGASAGTGPLATLIHTIGWRQGVLLFGFFGIALGIIVYFIFKLDRRDTKVEQETARLKSHLLENLKKVVTHKMTWVNALAALCFYMTTTAFAGLWGSSFLETSHGVSKEVAGYAMSMVFAGWLVGGPATGFFSDFLGKRKFMIGTGILGALLCLVPVIYMPSLSIYAIYILLFLVGLFSSAELLSFSLAIELNSAAAKATAAAFTNFIISCGDAIVQPLIGFLLDLHWTGAIENGIRSYSLGTYQMALSCLPISLFLAGLLLFFVKEKQA